MTASDEPRLLSEAMPARRPATALVVLGGVGLLANALAVCNLRHVQFNVVNYTAAIVDVPIATTAGLFVWILVLGPAIIGWRSLRSFDGLMRLCAACAPLALSLPIAALGHWSPPPPFACGIALVFGNAWAICRAAGLSTIATRSSLGRTGPLTLLVVGFVLACAFHVRTQINFFEHLMLGHADIGHYAEELKNCLAGRGLRSDSFPNTRLGWHFVPLFYLMVPIYALWRSPVMLMVVNAVLLHLPALIFYWAGGRWTRCHKVSLALGMAWLLLPSVSRLVYSNTYGFQWLYVTLPLLSILLVYAVDDWVTGSGEASRVDSAEPESNPRASRHLIVVFAMATLVLLAQETTASIIFGIGLSIALLGRRRTGFTLVLVAIVYVLLCTQWIIPHFAESGRYERSDLFGDAGRTIGSLLTLPVRDPALFFARLARPQNAYLLAVLLVSMGGLALAQWRMLVAIVPTLALLMLMTNADWLSIKFWHQATLLPILFVAAMVAVARAGNRERALGRAMMLVIAAAWSHWLWGFSPNAKAYEVYANEPALHRPDPRFALITRLRSEFSFEHTVLATERAAAHFTDYRRIYTGRRPHDADVIFIDRGDAWDTTGLAQSQQRWRRDPNYDVHVVEGDVIVFVRRGGAPAADE